MTEFHDNRETMTEPVGLEALELRSARDDRLFAMNKALALCVALRNTQAAIATGHDVVEISGVPSQQLLTDILLSMPIIHDESTTSGELLFDHYCEQTSEDNKTLLKGFLADFAREINHYTQSPGDISEEDRGNASMNIVPAVHQLTTWNELFVDKGLDSSRLAYEGGDISGFDPDIYRHFGSRDYLDLLMRTAELGGKSALSGQVRLRLLSEMDYLYSSENLT